MSCANIMPMHNPAVMQRRYQHTCIIRHGRRGWQQAKLWACWLTTLHTSVSGTLRHAASQQTAVALMQASASHSSPSTCSMSWRKAQRCWRQVARWASSGGDGIVTCCSSTLRTVFSTDSLRAVDWQEFDIAEDPSITPKQRIEKMRQQLKKRLGE